MPVFAALTYAEIRAFYAHMHIDWLDPPPEYVAWQGMKQRCFNPAATGFIRYGARGITVCERWRNSFRNFLADVGCRPSPAHSIDRIDNDGDYEPNNVRWATRSEQQQNRKRVRRTTIVVWPALAKVNPRGLPLRARRD